jgi:hypothetical protein
MEFHVPPIFPHHHKSIRQALFGGRNGNEKAMGMDYPCIDLLVFIDVTASPKKKFTTIELFSIKILCV